MMWGPKHVLLIIGRNKLCADLEDAMFRIKNYAAPVNTMNLDKKTPCAATGVCQDCSSPDRICNYWTIVEKSFVKHRIKIILVNEDLGFNSCRPLPYFNKMVPRNQDQRHPKVRRQPV